MTDSPIPSPPQMKPLTNQEAQEMMLTNFIWPVMCKALNGLRLSLPQVPIPHLFVTACGLFGKVVGLTVCQGSLTDVLKIRAACIQAFSEGVRAAKPQPGPVPNVNDMQKLDS